MFPIESLFIRNPTHLAFLQNGAAYTKKPGCQEVGPFEELAKFPMKPRRIEKFDDLWWTLQQKLKRKTNAVLRACLRRMLHKEWKVLDVVHYMGSTGNAERLQVTARRKDPVKTRNKIVLVWREMNRAELSYSVFPWVVQREKAFNFVHFTLGISTILGGDASSLRQSSQEVF